MGFQVKILNALVLTFLFTAAVVSFGLYSYFHTTQIQAPAVPEATFGGVDVIAFDASSIRTQDSGGGTTSTWSHTTTGSNRILFVGCAIGAGKTASGATYGGTAMTQVNTLALGGTTFDNGYLFRLVAPATGANDIVVTVSADTFIYCAATSFTGVDQTTPIDVQGTASATATSLGLSLTTTVDNDWLVGFWYYGTTDDDFTAGANTLVRQEDAAPGIWYTMGDTNSAQTPTGSKTITMTSANSRLQGVVGAAFSPGVVDAASTGEEIINVWEE